MRALVRHLGSFAQDEDGASIVEFAIVSVIFFFLFFGLIDFARLGYVSVMAEKATERAVRMAVVRAPACDGVAEINNRAPTSATPLGASNGTPCSAQAGLCVNPGTVTCAGNADNTTVAQIWPQVRGLLPANAKPENLLFSYDYDANLNRVGAAYAPIVTVALDDLTLDYISPLGALAAAAGARSSSNDLGGSYVFQSMSASLPAETLR